jgi:hypothetical protein
VINLGTNKDFLLDMWLQKRVTVAQINIVVATGKITQAEADTILNTPQT